MSQRNAHSARHSVRNQLDCSRQLRRNRQQPNLSFGSLKHPVKGGNLRRKQMLRRLHAALGMRKKRSFQMNTNQPRLAFNWRPLDEFRKSFQRPQRRIEWRGHSRRQIASRAVLGQKTANGRNRRGSCFHHVVAFSPVKVNVEEGWRQSRAGKVENTRRASQFPCRARRDGRDPPVLDRNHRLIDQPASVPEPLCCHLGSHAVDYRRPSPRAETRAVRQFRTNAPINYNYRYPDRGGSPCSLRL